MARSVKVILKELREKLMARVDQDRFLCDSCKYDHPSSCSRPERPNAKRCPEYRIRYSG